MIGCHQFDFQNIECYQPAAEILELGQRRDQLLGSGHLEFWIGTQPNFHNIIVQISSNNTNISLGKLNGALQCSTLRASFIFQQVMVVCVCVCNVNLRMTSSSVFNCNIHRPDLQHHDTNYNTHLPLMFVVGMFNSTTYIQSIIQFFLLSFPHRKAMFWLMSILLNILCKTFNNFLDQHNHQTCAPQNIYGI